MTDRSILFVGNHFKSKNDNVNVYQELPYRLQGCGWKVEVTSQYRTRVLRLADMLWSIYSKRDNYSHAVVDVFSGPSFLWAELSTLLLNRINQPVILSLRGGSLPDFVRRHPNRVKKVFSAAAALVAPSAYLSDQLKPVRDDIQVIPNPIDTHAYPFRQRTNIKPNLVWLRAFHEIYNPSLAPRMLKVLLQDWPDAHLTMVGPDKGDGSLQRMCQLASQLGVRGHITITGGVPRQEVPTCLDQADIFINTTNVDNTPVSLIEAMACGLCVVSTNVGGIPYLVKHEQDVLLVPPDDPQAMAGAVQKVLMSPALAGQVSSNGRINAERFDWSAILLRWQEFLATVC